MGEKIKMATASLAGCFGCHTSLLDIDERILDLVELVELDRTPFTDVKRIGDCDLGIVEGGVANEENLEVLLAFRRHCRRLLAIGACAIDGGIPSMRNQFTLRECLEESYFNGIGVHNPGIPNDPEIPLLLSRVQPIQDLVQVDYFLPGCPPSADAIWNFLIAFLEGRPVAPADSRIRYE